ADMYCRAVLADSHPLIAQLSCQASSEQGRVERGRAGEVDAAPRPVDVDVRPGLLGIEELHVLGSVAEPRIALEEFTQARHPGLRLGDVDMAAADLMGVDALGLTHLEDLVDRIEQRGLEGPHARRSVEARGPARPGRIGPAGTVDRLGVSGAVARKQSRQPAAVAARGTVADV